MSFNDSRGYRVPRHSMPPLAIVVQADLESGRLAALCWSESFGVVTQMAWHGERWTSPAAKAFLGTAREVFDRNEREKL